jgi:natural product biosynthesis luciferase-like monooxygenase protein/non-ribosomal peptide synthase protein (TIGR01720 family)
MLDSSKDIERSFALSPIQQGMLFHSLADKDPTLDVEQVTCSLHEQIDVTAMEQAWQQVLQRHESLRVSFQWQDVEAPVQHVHRELGIPFQLHDLCGQSREQQKKTFDEFLKADQLRGFGLDEAPLMRLTLFRFGESEFTLIWSLHHIIADGRSFIIVLREVFSIYEALRDGRTSELEAPPKYGDYIDWLQREDGSQRETFWKQYLRGFKTSIPFAVDKRRTAERKETDGYTREEQKIVMPIEALRRLSEENELSLNTIIQGAWSLLLHRYSGQDDIVFGAVRAGRKWSNDAVGLFINTLPVRVQVSPEQSLVSWLRELRHQQRSIRDFENTPLVQVQSWSEMAGGLPLFESLLIFDHGTYNDVLRSPGGSWLNREFQLIENSGFPLTLYAYAHSDLQLKIAYDGKRFENDTIARMLGHLQTLLESMTENPAANLDELTLLTEAEQHQLLVEWNHTDRDLAEIKCIHELFEAQADATPQATALVFNDSEMTYAELNTRANQLAHRLKALGVGPEMLVGIFMERSLEMMVTLLGILKAGGAYVPLDPGYPKERLAFMISDAQLKVIVAQSDILTQLPAHQATLLELDPAFTAIAEENGSNLDSGVTATNLAYVIYTSGSTGKPKGVMLCHSNVVNFFAGMDERIDYDSESQGTWIAVTSISFDISVLELFWTLTRGFKVVLQPDEHFVSTRAQHSQTTDNKQIDFSLFYFANAESGDTGKPYRLLMEGARFADCHGFSAVWTPERHFHAFGGWYPNPSVMGAALASITEQIQIRAGSVVLPLHQPIRVAEEWSVVDNLSGGRVGISVASGWQPNDFVLAPDNHAERKEIMMREIETVRKLWRGEKVAFEGVGGKTVDIGIMPHPIQKELPIWVTAGGSPVTFREAGEIGANLLTHLLGQSAEQLAEKIQIYREAFRQQSDGKQQGHVTLMLHTYLGSDPAEVREKVREPFSNYLKTSLDLVKLAPLAFPNFSRQGAGKNENKNDVLTSDDFTEEDMAALVSFAFDRYFETHGLFGSPETCLEKVERLKAIGVDEIACLIDFGVDEESVLQGLKHLNRLKENSKRVSYSIPQQIARQHVTHMQCTPSMAKTLAMDPDTSQSLKTLQYLLLGGEALPKSLIDEIMAGFSGRLLNMYGPTETTIWSSSETVRPEAEIVSIGKPIANTQLYILDQKLRPVPIGVPGELFIGGDGVARGYLERPGLTTERFIPNPFSDRTDARLYRTGDEARYLPDGRIEFVGRLDDQVKIRGHRIELGEISAALEQLPLVNQAVVVARKDLHGEQRLVAYVTTRPTAATIDGLRESLRTVLPEFMIPAAFVKLSEFPLTPNGKIDRRALPEPNTGRPDLQKSFVAARTEEERLLVDLWRQVLGIERIGVHDNFFDLGGDSILAVQIAVKARKANIQVNVSQVLAHQTIAELAQAVQLIETTPLQQGFATRPFGLTPMQQWLVESGQAEHHSRTLLLKVPADLDSDHLQQALRHIVNRHSALRMRIEHIDTGWQQMIDANSDEVMILSSIDASRATSADQDVILGDAIEKAQADVSLSTGCLFKAVHITFGGDRPGRVLLTAHRLMIDDVSWSILLQDLQTAYQQLAENEPMQLPPRTTSFEQWAADLLRATPTVAADYWLALADCRFSPLPRDYTDANGAHVDPQSTMSSLTSSLTTKETQDLRVHVAEMYGARVSEAAITALLEATSKWTKTMRLFLDIEETARRSPIPGSDLSRSIGCFTDHFPVLLDITDTRSIGDELKTVKEQLRKLSDNAREYGLARYHGTDELLRTRLNALPRAEILFQDLGEFTPLTADPVIFEPISKVPVFSAPTVRPGETGPYLLELAIAIVDNKLNVVWRYNEAIHRRSTIEQLSDNFIATLRSIIAHCTSREQREYTPSDFPLANLDQKKLDALAAKLNRRDRKNTGRASANER